jgi:hypothetical protein
MSVSSGADIDVDHAERAVFPAIRAQDRQRDRVVGAKRRIAQACRGRQARAAAQAAAARASRSS